MAPLLTAIPVLRDAQGAHGPLWASLGTSNPAMAHRGARNPLISEPLWFGLLLSVVSCQGHVPADTWLIFLAASSQLGPSRVGAPELGHTDGCGC